MLDFLIDLLTESGAVVDLILVLTGIYIYLSIEEDYNKRLEELEGGVTDEN